MVFQRVSNVTCKMASVALKEIERDGMPYLTGALASDGVVDGAVEEAGVRIVR